MTSHFHWDALHALPLIGILRGFSREQVEELVKASVAGGLKNIEITMNSPAAAEMIRLAAEVAGPGVNVGAGTVCSITELDAALEAGASFIVTPLVVPEVLAACAERSVPTFPGALTPTEIFQAWKLGAAMVKVFPAERMGPEYIRDVKAPLNQVKLLPTGGITHENLAAYKAAGADGFGLGSPLYDKQLIAARDWAGVTERVERFADAYRNA